MQTPQFSLLESERLVAELRKRRSSVFNVCKEVCRSAIFIIFIVLYVFIVLYETQSSYREFTASVSNALDKKATVSVDDVQSIPDLWKYVNHTLFAVMLRGELHRTRSDTLLFADTIDSTTVEGAWIDEFGTRIVSGTIVLRTFRVAKNRDCAINILFDPRYDCYPGYSVSTETTRTFGSGRSVFQYGSPEVLPLVNVTKGTVFPSVTGSVGTYRGSGFVMTFGGSLKDAATMVDKAVQKRFLDEATRALLVEFTVYNPSVGYMAPVRIMFEIAATGRWINSLDINVVNERYLWMRFDTGMVVELLLLLGVCYYVSVELAELLITKKKYFSDGWNLVDWANLILLIIYFAFRIRSLIEGGGVMDRISAATYTDLSSFAYYISAMRSVNSLNCVFLMLKVFKTINAVPFRRSLILTVRDSWRAFVSFALCMLLVSCGYSLAYNIAFGERFPRLSTLYRSYIYLVRSLASDVDVTQVYESSPGMGGVLIMSFSALMYFMLLNVFYGIMVVAVADAKIHVNRETNNRFKAVVEFAKKFAGYLNHELQLVEKFDAILRAWAIRRNQPEEEICEKEEDVETISSQSSYHGKVKKEKTCDRYAREESSSESEADLGPLCREAVNKRKRKNLQGIKPPLSDKELALQAIQHLGEGLKQRRVSQYHDISKDLRNLQHVCASVHVVIEVLVRRAQDLDSQQISLIKRM